VWLQIDHARAELAGVGRQGGDAKEQPTWQQGEHARKELAELLLWTQGGNA